MINRFSKPNTDQRVEAKYIENSKIITYLQKLYTSPEECDLMEIIGKNAETCCQWKVINFQINCGQIISSKWKQQQQFALLMLYDISLTIIIHF